MTEQEKLDIISDVDNAEAIYRFVMGNERIYYDFHKKRLENPLSMAEYVLQYRADQFISRLSYLKGWKVNG